MKIANKSFCLELNTSACSVTFDENVVIGKAAGKTTEQMRNLLYNQNSDKKEQLYQFFVGVTRRDQLEAVKKTGLRYDVILIGPGTIDGEYKKTSGHAHIGLYPEIYEVLHGKALFLLQKGSGDKIKEFAAVETNVGQKILIPPEYTHATVNIGDGPLLFSDLVADQCHNRYEDVQGNHGMAYYILEESRHASFRKNSNYQFVPEVKKLLPSEQAGLGLLFNSPIYDILTESPNRFEYLSQPEKHLQEIRYLAEEIERMK